MTLNEKLHARLTALHIVTSSSSALSASGIEGQRSLVYDSIVGAVDRAPIVIEDLRLEDTTFSKSTLISGLQLI